MEQQLFTREALYDLVWSTSLLSLSKRYDLSNTGFRKLCNRMKIPLPKNGHWQQVKFGKADKQPALPQPYRGDGEVTLRLRTEEVTEKRVPRPVIKAQPLASK